MGRSPVGQGGKGVFDFSASLTANGTERKRAGKNVHLKFFLAEFSCCSSESRSQAKKAEYTPPKAEGSHVWKRKEENAVGDVRKITITYKHFCQCVHFFAQVFGIHFCTIWHILVSLEFFLCAQLNKQV